MGISLARQVQTRALAGTLPPLTHAARCVLFVAAFDAHDTGTKDTPRAYYFGSWERLGRVGLGRATYDDNAERAVGRAVRELVDAGLFKPRGRRHGERQGNAQYEVTL